MKMLEQACGVGCRGWTRREMLGLGAVAGLNWLTPLARALAVADERKRDSRPARSVILLWMAGGPSQLETFDPHSDKPIAYGGKSIQSAIRGVRVGAGLERCAGVLDEVTLVRSVVSKEADHERAVYQIKTGYRPNPTVVHPAIGAVICHEIEDPGFDIPRHISILPEQWPSRGGYLGAQHDAFLVNDPKGPVQDIHPAVPDSRLAQRMKDLEVIERAFAVGRSPRLESGRTLHRHTMNRALKIMSSAQLAAFDVMQASAVQRAAYGETPFGRGCLAALRLIESGVRCVEVTLSGWDTHVNNHSLQSDRIRVLDPALAALIRDLKQKDLLDSTLVLCGGEFGRTPKLNALEGRDHWPYGFSLVLAGGGIRRGFVKGSTDPEGTSKEPMDPVRVEDIHATIQHAMGIDPAKELVTPVGRPLALSEGRVIRDLLVTARV